jgi:hypothetical protein
VVYWGGFWNGVGAVEVERRRMMMGMRRRGVWKAEAEVQVRAVRFGQRDRGMCGQSSSSIASWIWQGDSDVP